MGDDRFSELDPTNGPRVNAISTVLGAPSPAPAASDPLDFVLRAAQAGDRARLRQLLERITPVFLAVIRRVLGGSHPAVEDVLQESLVAFVRALGSFKGNSNIVTYATRIAICTAIGHRKKSNERARWD